MPNEIMKNQNKDTNLPEIINLNDLSDYFGMPPFPHRDFLYMKIENEENFFGIYSKPLRHRLYAISLILECNGTLNAGFWKAQPQKPAIYIKTPYQVVSWDFDPKVKRKFIIVFSENFISEHSSLGNLIFDYPFFQLDKAIPFELEEKDVSTLSNVFENIGIIYNYSSPEQFNIIASYVKILLLHISEMYNRYVCTDNQLADTISSSNDKIANSFFTLVKREILAPTEGDQDYSVAFFADKLSVHPNHLSTILKKQTGKTAQEHIHSALIGAAKTLLVQTDLTMKEVAYRLCFKEPAHFANFFKKLEKVTPLQYRNANRL
jgi:AraC-like DNA-binding protein